MQIKQKRTEQEHSCNSNKQDDLTMKAVHKIKHIDAFIIGCGTVGGALINQIKEQQPVLLNEYNIDLKIYGIANRSTFMMNENGIDLMEWSDLLNKSKQLYSLNNLHQFIRDNQLKNPIIVDCTGSRSVALEYDNFFAHGMHIITANKIANGESIDYYLKIRKTAKKFNKRFQYETNIGAGLPVIEPLQKLLKAGDLINKFEGILSGSLSYIFGELHSGLSLSQATLKAKKLGYTEPDPREDLNGLDVARKILIVAREVGMEINLSDVEVESVLPMEYENLSSSEFLQRLPELDSVFEKRVRKAEEEDEVLRYVATLIDGKCKVSIESLPKSNPLYGVMDGENVLAFYSRYYQPKPLVIKGYGAGPAVTAAGVFSDILRIVD